MPRKTARATTGKLTPPPSFPAGDYTPHGYIDNPHHSMVLNRSGVIRSVPPLGFGYWLRKFKGSYGTGTRGHVNYLSLLQMSVAAGQTRLVTAEDFTQAGIELVSRYHSQHVLSYDWSHDGLTFSLRYFLPREHTLACLVEVANAGTSRADVLLHATHVYGLWETRWWGADGVGMRYLADVGAAVSTIWAYGDYFALGGSAPSAAHKATGSREQWQQWLRAGDLTSGDTGIVRGAGPLHTVMSYKLAVPARGRATALVCLSRATNEPGALHELRAGLRDALPRLKRQLAADEAFWSRCQRLEGDWPATWRHGWVYDWETLRMNVRPPLGIFKHPWDAMQVHSPRSVLAEASVDMLTLSHAAPDVAKDVMYGTFADAPVANVPCCREDGSMNMIAADGSACGTAPSWCFPFHVLRAIYAATGDAAWVKRLYPHLRAYIDWWLEHRVDEHGWLHCKCDWESGQDGSKRFPEVEGGSAETVRTVDVEAGTAEALRILALFARVAGKPADARRWAKLADERAASTRTMFVDGWYRDFDTRTNQPIILPDYVDVMMLAPLTCGIASPEQIEALRPKFQYFRDHPRGWLEWGSFLLLYTEAAWNAGVQQLAGEVTADIADRVYRRTDARHLHFVEANDPYAYRIPGVANEYWPLTDDVEPGGENYGWGATLPLHIIRTIMGFRETEALPVDGAKQADVEFHLAPALPQRLMTPGKSYTVRNLHFRGVTASVRYDVTRETALRATLDYSAARPGVLTISDASGRVVAGPTKARRSGRCAADAENGSVLTVRWADR